MADTPRQQAGESTYSYLLRKIAHGRMCINFAMSPAGGYASRDSEEVCYWVMEINSCMSKISDISGPECSWKIKIEDCERQIDEIPEDTGFN